MLKYNNIRIRREDDDKLNMLKNLKGMSKTELVSELLQNVSDKVIDQVLDKDPDFYEIKRHILKPSYKKRESSRPPTAILDACILNQLKFNGSNPIIKTRNELKRGVVDFLSKGWIQLFKSFAKDAEERHSQFDRFFDNRLRELKDDGLLQSTEPSGYQLQNKLTSDNWELIDAMLIIPPHKDIKLTKLRLRPREDRITKLETNDRLQTNPIIHDKLRNLKIGDGFSWDCMEGKRVGRHKERDCTLWQRVKEQQGNFRRRYDWGKDYYLVRNCENGVFSVQRYDKEKAFDNTTRERIHYSNLIQVKDSKKNRIQRTKPLDFLSRIMGKLTIPKQAPVIPVQARSTASDDITTFNNLKVNERMVVSCEQGTRVGLHKCGRGKLTSEDCSLWRRFANRSKEIRRRGNVDFWVDIKCIDGEVRVLRYDKENPPIGIDSRTFKGTKPTFTTQVPSMSVSVFEKMYDKFK